MSRGRTAVVVMALAALLLPALPAAAAGADRTGWWSSLAAGGLVAPPATSADDDLRVAGSGERVTAYAALLLTAPGSASADLVLEVREGRSLGVVEVVACPTTGTAWEAGPNQPAEAGPEYDCGRGTSFGVLSEDGSTLAFGLGSDTQAEPGTWSLALVPLPDGAAGFSVDLVAPGAEAFTPAPPVDDPAPDGGADPPPSGGDGGLAGLLTGGSAPGGDGFGGGGPGGFGEGGDGLDGGLAPLLAGGDDAALAVEPSPELADELAPAPALVSAPQRPPAPGDLAADASRSLLAVLALVALAAALGRASATASPPLRLLGGRAGVMTGAGAAAPEGGPAVGAASSPGRPRGIGRFARERDAPPRRLR